MNVRGTLEVVKLKGTVKNGMVAVDLPDGTPVILTVDDPIPCPGPRIALDANGDLMMTPELAADLAEGEAQLDRGEGIPWRDVIDALRSRR